MSAYVNGGITEEPLHFAYRRLSRDNQHKETFHSHHGIEILLIHEGKGTMIVNNVSYEIKAGMLCIFQPFQLHHLTLEYTDHQTFERSLAIFEPTLFESYFERWPALHAFFNSIHLGLLPSPCIYGIDHQHELAALFQSMQQKLDAAPAADKLEEASLFLLFLFRALKPVWMDQQNQITPFRTRRNHQVENMLSWIEQHYANPFHLDEMAKELHLSTYHLSHLFKESIGITITEYIAARRAHQAVRLLTATDKPITLIAEEIGITNSSYFCKFFKERMGITPHQYRKQWRITHNK